MFSLDQILHQAGIQGASYKLDCALSRCHLAPFALVAMYGLLVRQQSSPCYLYQVALVDGDVTMTCYLYQVALVDGDIISI